MHSRARPGTLTWPYLCVSTKGKGALLRSASSKRDCQTLGGAVFGLPCRRLTGRTTASGKSYHWQIVSVCRARYVAKDLPASPGGSCLCCEINFLTKKQSFLSCNPRLMSQHFTRQLFTTKSKKSNFKTL